MPAATSLILADLVLLSEITNEQRFTDDAMKSINSESQLLDRAPTAAVVATQAFNRFFANHPEMFEEPVKATTASTSPVQMTCSPKSLELAVGQSAEIAIQFKMKKDWHINSSNPVNEYAVPLAFKVLNENVSLETSWPQSKQMVSGGEVVQVYSDNVSIPITVRANEGAKGSIQLMVTWQACNEELCLESTTVQVPCSITVK